MKTATQKFRLIARNKRWVSGAIVSEHFNDEGTRRFTATIRGWQKWFIWEGSCRDSQAALDSIIAKVREIRDRIDAGDESVFELPQGKPLVA